MKFLSILGLVVILAVPAFGLISWQLSDPILNLLDNSVTEIVVAGDYVWVSTGLGLSGSTDRGANWRSFNSTNEFTSDGVSGIAFQNGRLWVATASSEVSAQGTGLYRTDNQGDDWDSLGGDQLSAIGKIAYDLAAHDSVLYAACYYGGLGRSLDGGNSWEPIFLDSTLRDDYEADGLINEVGSERGRYYAVAIDPYEDGLKVVWAGSARGVQAFYFLSKYRKLISNRVIDIATSGDDWWYATDRGITKFHDSTLIFQSWDSQNGLPEYSLSAIAAKGDTVIAGLLDTLSNTAQGFVMTTDGGTTWEINSTPQAVGAERKVEELAFRGNDIWAACSKGGLIRSADLGNSWVNVYFDDSDTSISSLLNRINCIDVIEREDFFRVSAGTDSGVVSFYFTSQGDLDSTVHLSMADNLSYGQKVLTVATFKSEFGEEYWAGVNSYKADFGQRPATLRSTNGGFTWDAFLIGPPAVTTFDIEIGEEFGDTVVWAATSAGMRRTTNFGPDFSEPSYSDFVTGKSLQRSQPFQAVEMGLYETHEASADSGVVQTYLARFNSQIFVANRVVQANLDPNQTDGVFSSFVADGEVPEEGQLSGNWVVALGVQPTGDSTIIWSSTRRGNDLGHLALCYTTNRGATWVETIADVNIWNIAFNGDTVFFAADEGLYMSTDFGENWTELQIKDPVSGREIADDVPVYAMRMVGDQLWAGTEDGLAISENLTDWTIIRTFVEIPADPSDDDRSYVSPSPYSPYLGIGNLKFHYKLKNDGKVTITIYDFANNVVKTVVDGADRVAATQYDDVDTWDGTNSNGEKVAAGVYFYRLESSSGEDYWGKFMVIP